MAAAASLQPNGWPQADGFVCMLRDGPDWFGVGQQVHFEGFPAPSRAKHGGRPVVTVCADDIDDVAGKFVRETGHVLTVIDGRLPSPPYPAE